MIQNRAVRNEATHGVSLKLERENAGLRKLIADQVYTAPLFYASDTVNRGPCFGYVLYQLRGTCFRFCTGFTAVESKS